MATSTLGHYVRFGTTAIDGLDPVDSGMAGRALGNLNHLADQYAQVRVAWVGYSSQYFTYNQGQEPANGYWGLVWLSSAFDMHLRSDGTTYRCRARMRAEAAALMGFRLVLAPVGQHYSEMQTNDSSNVADISVDGAGAWYDAASLLYLDAARAHRAQQTVATADSAGGDAISARWLRAQVAVYALSDGSTVPKLSGVQLAEYYAP